MALIDRRGIRAALEARLRAGLGGVRAWYDRPLAPGEASVRPAAALFNDTQRGEGEHGGPLVWTLSLVLQVHVAGGARGLDDQLDEAIGQVEAALGRQADEAGGIPGVTHGTTLGGRVFDCRIGGDVQFFSEVGSSAAMVEIPIEIDAVPA